MNVIEFVPDPKNKNKRRFRVITDDKYTGPKAVMNAPSLPRLNDELNIDDKVARLTHFDARQAVENPHFWTVTATYETIETVE